MIHKMNEIKALIQRYGIKNNCRKRELVYMRYYMYRQLRKWMTLEQVGRLFDRDHSSVIHGIKMARLFEHMKDEIYYEYVKHIRADYMALIDEQATFSIRKIDYVHGTAIMYLNLPIEKDVFDSIEHVDLNQFKQVLECVNGV